MAAQAQAPTQAAGLATTTFWAIAGSLALAKLLLHVITSAVNPYGYFRDELYYIACSERLAWGYVDHPPASALLTRAVTTTIGDSVDAIRMLPALAGAAFVILTCLIARELGGRTFAVLLTAVCVLFAPVYLTVFGMLSTIPFDHLIWGAVAFLLVRLVKTHDQRYWLVIGGTIGIGLLTKHNAAFLAVAVAVGTVATANRRYLRSPWLWAGVAAALLLAAPHIWWQADNGWPTLEFVGNASEDKNALGGPIELIALQALVMLPFALPIWIAGLVWLLRSTDGAPFRMLAAIWFVPLLILLIQGGSRPDYLTPAYPPLLAAGAVAIEGATAAHRQWLRPVGIALVLVGGLAFAPISVNVLPAEQLASYTAALGLDELEAEEGKTSALPQYFADRFGWEEMVDALAEVRSSLPLDERERAVVLAGNYGEAGAVGFFGEERGLEPAISGHNNYHIWGPRDADGSVLIVIGYSEGLLRRHFGSVTVATIFACNRYCTSEEQDLPIYIVREPMRPLADMWDEFQHYD